MDSAERLKALRDVKNQINWNRTKKLCYIKLGAVRRIVEVLAFDSEVPLLVQSATVVGSFACGIDVGVQTVIDCGLLPHLLRMLTNLKQQDLWIKPSIGKKTIKWCRRLPLLGADMRRMRDFYMEITFHFESSVIPFVGQIAPSNTYKIWKHDSNLHTDMTVVGFDGFWIQHYDQSFSSSAMAAMTAIFLQIESIFSGKASTEMRESAMNLTKRLAQTTQDMYRDFEEAVEKDSTKTAVLDGTVHPLTSYVINYVKFLFEPALIPTSNG